MISIPDAAAVPLDQHQSHHHPYRRQTSNNIARGAEAVMEGDSVDPVLLQAAAAAEMVRGVKPNELPFAYAIPEHYKRD